VHQSIMDGVRQALSPEDVAANIRDTITLTAQQSQAVANFRQLVETGDPAVFARALRDQSFDNLLEMAVDGEDLRSDIVDQIVQSYADNYLDYRAKTIADTESMRAANLGLRESYRQAVDRGVFPAEAIKRFWLIALDEKTCQLCIDISDMNDQGVGVDEPFQGPDGEVDDPPDPHPACRCSVQYETDLSMIPADDSTDAEAAAA